MIPEILTHIKTSHMVIDKGIIWGKKIVFYNGILLSHKNKEIMPFAATWMD